MIHLQGMGIPGCLTALLLERKGIDFTWHDKQESVNAWRASTGAIYPSDSTKFGPDWECRSVWKEWHDSDLTDGCTEEAYWVYSQKRPPHGSKYEAHALTCGLNLAQPTAFHLNAQAMVPGVWERFADRRRDEAAAGDTTVITHGFGVRRSHSYWGWTRLVELDWDRAGLPDLRPSFYFREGRFRMCYAYCVPGTRYWYAGSHIIKQALGKERSLEMEPKYARWREHFLRMGNGAVQIVGEHDFLEGWRPACGDDDWVRQEGDRLVSLRPLWNSGIRHYPKQWSELCRLLEI